MREREIDSRERFEREIEERLKRDSREIQERFKREREREREEKISSIIIK